jgi:hypothetical protein
MAPGRPILLADLADAQCRALAEETLHMDYPGVVGPDRTAHWFARHASERSVQFLEPMPQRIRCLTAKPSYPSAPGQARLGTAGCSPCQM